MKFLAACFLTFGFASVAHAEFTKAALDCHDPDKQSPIAETKIWYTYEAAVNTPGDPDPRQSVYHLEFFNEAGDPTGPKVLVRRSTPDLDLTTVDGYYEQIAFDSVDAVHLMKIALNMGTDGKSADSAKGSYAIEGVVHFLDCDVLDKSTFKP
jgi:hypothetical protein